MTPKRILIAVVLLLILASGYFIKQGGFKREAPVPIPESTPLPTPLPVVKEQPKKTTVTKAKSPVVSQKPKAVVPTGPVAPPPVTLHKELIPKDITIVRVYYEQQITGPGSVVEFDINGSGFNAEFQKMITAESGSPTVAVKNLKLMTPNQIHGVLVVKSDTLTGVVFPQVLIQGKVVFRAPEPLAVIRPGEVLNVVFIERGEDGRSGRFRVFTNLTEAMYSHFEVIPSTISMRITNVEPHLPFIVDGVLTIGGAMLGSYGLDIKLGSKTIWSRPGMIQIIQPNVGEAGLTQEIRPADGFHRPGDNARFMLFGSGFQPNDINLLKVKVDPFDVVKSTMIFRSPGRMELAILIPENAGLGFHKISILQDDKILMAQEKAFEVVPQNWIREMKTDPALKPGTKGQIKLVGRDLDKKFIDSIQVEVDSEDLKIGKFTWVSAVAASAEVSVGPSLAPGDYLIKMTSEGNSVTPQFGSLIKINP